MAPEELQMAKTLVKASTGDFALDKYPDLYTSKL
jgi:non-homologous end joining protein Ku